ncbi:50S ribosomal protein L18 [Candidatus Wolfebacteria bacterium]|nr:50S ribosomal protein L18 [Candidatus Wolfebacteria bacterium]
MNNLKEKRAKKIRRKNRNNSRFFGTKSAPRLSVFRSNKFIYAQLIDDEAKKTLISTSSRGLSKGTKTEQAKTIGEQLAEKALKEGIKKAVFNKGPYTYHGRVKAVADGAREKGLKF